VVDWREFCLSRHPSLAEQLGYEVTILCLNDTHLNAFYTFSDKINFRSIKVSGNPMQYILHYIKGIRKTVAHLQPDVIAVCDDGLKGVFCTLYPWCKKYRLFMSDMLRYS